MTGPGPCDRLPSLTLRSWFRSLDQPGRLTYSDLMTISSDDVAEFREAWKADFAAELTPAEGYNELQRLLELFAHTEMSPTSVLVDGLQDRGNDSMRT